MSEQNSVTIPRWIGIVIVGTCGVLSAIATLGIPWANYVAGKLSAIETQMVSNAEVNTLNNQHIRERITVNEGEVRELRMRLRELEQEIGVKRQTTSRPVSD